MNIFLSFNKIKQFVLDLLIGDKNPQQLLQSYNQIEKVLTEIFNSKVFYGGQVQRFWSSLSEFNADPTNSTKLKVLTIELERLQQSIRVIGKFDAKNDQTLFLREGVVNFFEMGNVFNKIANLYSLR